MSRGIDFKQKQVIDINTGKILGNVIDVQADFNNGEIESIVVARVGKVFASIYNCNWWWCYTSRHKKIKKVKKI